METGDNVDIRFRVRHMMQSNQNKDHHLFHLIAYKNRVSGNHLPDHGHVADPNQIPLATFLPSIEDNEKLVYDFVVIVGNVWVKHIESLAWFKEFIPKRMGHEYTKEMSAKTAKVHLGVIEKNEQKLEDMVDICRFLHKYVPGNCGEDTDGPEKNVEKVLSGGDYLTFERHKTALERQQDGRTPSKRMAGLQPKMEDFHQQAEWLAVLAWDKLYNTSSKSDIGTLHSARCAIQARNVTSDPRQCYYAASDLMNKVTDAYLVAGALEYFQMTDTTSSPTDNVYTGSELDNEAKREYVWNIILQFVKQHVMCEVSTLPEDLPTTNEFKCKFCGKNYKQVAALIKHEQDIHNFHPKEHTQPEPEKKKDHKYNYTRNVLIIGMLMKSHNLAIAMGNGLWVVTLMKYFLLFYKSTKKCPKYAFGTYETLVQALCLLPPRLAHRLIWNRFVNYRGRADSNHPMDLDVEHANKAFKEELHSYRGEVTQRTISRISLSLNFTEDIMHNYDGEIAARKASGKHTSLDSADDVKSLATQFHSAKLFKYIPGRHHASYPEIPESPIENVNMTDLWKWMSKNLKGHTSKVYYRQ